MSAPRLVLKQPNGWFAAGAAFGEALSALSDSAFKLFAWVCLHADRHTGRIRITVPEMAQALSRAESGIQEALDEVVEHGVCDYWGTGVIEVADDFWPYEKPPLGSGPQDYVAAVRRLLSAPACVRCRFSVADQNLARNLHQRGISLEQVDHGIWLGCARRYAMMLANPAVSTPIVSLSYFVSTIQEVVNQPHTPDAYWLYTKGRAQVLEGQWMTGQRGQASDPVSSDSAPPSP
jgi:hypothetical protein